MQWARKLKNEQKGFTIVELLIVVVVIAILAAITIVSYNGIQQRSNDSRRMSDIQVANKAINMYFAQHGSYPVTGTGVDQHRSDSNCSVGSKSVDWIPDVVPTFISKLPQSDGKSPNGANTGCYKYWSDGTNYVVTAWIAREGDPQTNSMYRRVGFREGYNGVNDQYYCNHASMGGISTGTYDLSKDLYKKSFTIANTPARGNSAGGTCNEAPPAGA